MKNQIKNLNPRFGPEVRFSLEPARPRLAQSDELERLKNRLLRDLTPKAGDPEESARLQRAADESAALVWLTPCPLLLFPALLEEKARTARLEARRQSRIRRRSRKLLALAE